MHSAWTIVEALLPIVSLIIVAAGIAGGSFRISQNARTVSVYRDSAQAWQTRAESLEADNKTLEDENRRLVRRNRELEDANAELRRRVASPGRGSGGTRRQ